MSRMSIYMTSELLHSQLCFAWQCVFRLKRPEDLCTENFSGACSCKACGGEERRGDLTAFHQGLGFRVCRSGSFL